MPYIKQNIYGCSECADEQNQSPQLEFVGGFRSNRQELTMKVYKCPHCESIFLSINDEFLDGTFEDILN